MLRPQKSEDGSFYETFSDLIFGTMAIFVLLFILFVLMIRPKVDIKPPEPVDLIIAFDTSSSMSDQLKELKPSLLDLGKNFPRLIEDFRIGFVAYNSNYDDGVEIFPLTKMDFRGVRLLEEYMRDDVKIIAGSVDVTRGLERSLSLFGDYSPAGRQRALVIIGDVGPYEVRFDSRGATSSVSATDQRQLERRAQQMISEYVSASSENYVVSIYSVDRPRTDSKNYRYFCSLAASADNQGDFAVTKSALVWTLLQSIIPKPTILINGEELDDNPEKQPIEC